MVELLLLLLPLLLLPWFGPKRRARRIVGGAAGFTFGGNGARKLSKQHLQHSPKGSNAGVRIPNSRGQAKAWESVSPTQGATPKHGSPYPQLKEPRKSVGVRIPNSRGHAKAWDSVSPTRGATQKRGSPAFARERIWRCTWAGVLLRMLESTSQQTTFFIVPRLANLALKSTDGLMKRKHTLKKGGVVGAMSPTHYLSKTRLKPVPNSRGHTVAWESKKKVASKIV